MFRILVPRMSGSSLVGTFSITIHRYLVNDNLREGPSEYRRRDGQEQRGNGRGVPRRTATRSRRGDRHRPRHDPRAPPRRVRGDDELGDDQLPDPAVALSDHVQRPAVGDRRPRRPGPVLRPVPERRVHDAGARTQAPRRLRGHRQEARLGQELPAVPQPGGARARRGRRHPRGGDARAAHRRLRGVGAGRAAGCR